MLTRYLTFLSTTDLQSLKREGQSTDVKAKSRKAEKPNIFEIILQLKAKEFVTT